MKKKVDLMAYLWALSPFCFIFHEKRNKINRHSMYNLVNVYVAGGKTSVPHSAGLKPRLRKNMNMLVEGVG